MENINGFDKKKQTYVVVFFLTLPLKTNQLNQLNPVCPSVMSLRNWY